MASTQTLVDEYTVHSLAAQWGIVCFAAGGAWFSSVTANAFYPAITPISETLHVGIEPINLSVTYYTIVQGRRPVYMLTFLIYIGATLGLTRTTSYSVLVAMRCIQAFGSSSAVSIGAGVIGDIAPPKRRGSYMGLFTLGMLSATCMGPVFAGLLSQRWGWHAIFSWAATLAGLYLILLAFLMHETLRSIVGNGSFEAPFLNRRFISFLLPSKVYHHKEGVIQPTKKGWKDVRPWETFMMFKEPDVVLLLAFSSTIWVSFLCVTTSASTSFKNIYGLSESAVGLCFLANGGGCCAAAVISGRTLDRDYKIVKRQLEEKRAAEGERVKEEKDANALTNFPIEHARLRSLPAFVVLLTAAILVNGWTLEKGVHIAAPLVAQFFVGMSVTICFNVATTLLVDLYPGKSASASAANNLSRCLLGAAGQGFIEPLIQALGNGWAFTLIAGINLVMVPMIADDHVTPRKRGILDIIWDGDRHLKSKEENRLINKLDAAILSTIMFGYWMKFIDQANISNAYVSGMREDLNLYGNEYTFMQSLYNAALCICTIPGTMLATKVRPSVWLSACEIGWMAFTFSQAGARNAQQMYCFRFMVGLFEASFAPVAVVVMGSWYTKKELSKRVLVYFVLPDYPDNNRSWFLSDEEREMAKRRCARSGIASVTGKIDLALAKHIFGSWRVWFLIPGYIIFACSVQTGSYFTTWMRFSGFSVTDRNILDACKSLISIPFSFGYGLMADLTGKRWVWMAGPETLSIIPMGIIAIYPPNRRLIEICFLFSEIVLITPVYFAWINEICHENAQERAFMAGAANALFYMVNSWLPILLWPQTTAPRYKRGFIATWVFIIATVPIIIGTHLMHKRQMRREAARGQLSPETPLDRSGVEDRPSEEEKEKDFNLGVTAAVVAV
ncbi:MFS transporter [Pseudohyphozyma bogoriensis]|nr:MFS transporter [Pseudohyphozyma bogoriensis]